MPGKASNMMQINRTAWGMFLGLAAVLALVMEAGPAMAQLSLSRSGEETVFDIKIIGNNITPEAEVMRYIHTRKGDSYDKSKITKDIEDLINSRKFENAWPQIQPINGNQVLVTYFITERKATILEVIYRHAHHISQKDLEELTPRHPQGGAAGPGLELQGVPGNSDVLSSRRDATGPTSRSRKGPGRPTAASSSTSAKARSCASGPPIFGAARSCASAARAAHADRHQPGLVRHRRDLQRGHGGRRRQEAGGLFPGQRLPLRQGDPRADFQRRFQQCRHHLPHP